jgi:hypothetical protein
LLGDELNATLGGEKKSVCYEFFRVREWFVDFVDR